MAGQVVEKLAFGGARRGRKMPDDNNGGYMDLNNIEGAEVEDNRG